MGFLGALTTDYDPSLLPLSPELEYTENGEQIEPGEGFWQTAGATRFQRNVLDTETCGTHTQAVVDEDGADVIVGVRLQLEDDEVTEIETLITREDDYWFYDPDLLVASDEEIPAEVGWEEPVPEDRRATRDEMIDLADGYFESFGDEVLVPMDNGCQRSENGQRTSAGDCGVGLDRVTPELVTKRRYPLVDVEAGIAVAYVLFGEALDFHMFKIVDGEIRMIDALVTASEHDSSGWEGQE